MGRLGDEGPADEIFETLLRHRPPSISPDTAVLHAMEHPVGRAVVPLWYRMHRPICPDRPRRWTHRKRRTLRDTKTPESARLGAERSLVQIQSPRLKSLLTRGFSFASRGTNWATGNNFSDRAPSCGGLVPGRTRTDASPSRASTTSRSKPYAVQPWRCSLAFVSAMFALMFERFALVAARFRRFFCRRSFARSRPQAGSAVAATGIRVFVIVHAT